LLTELIFEEAEGHRGMDPTRALLDGVLKYKRFHDGPSDRNKFVYHDQRPILEFVAGPVPLDVFARTKSVECQIMDWADDIAYGLMDIVDGVNARFLSMESVEKWAARREMKGGEAALLDEFLKSLREGKINARFARKIGKCIQACQLVEEGDSALGSLTRRHAFRLDVQEDVLAEVKFYKAMAVELIFRTPQIKQLEWKGKRMLKELFGVLADNYAQGRAMELLPHDTHHTLIQETDSSQRMRVICDYMAGMTDHFAARTYRRFFDPDYGSIGDL
jgi:dGTPase